MGSFFKWAIVLMGRCPSRGLSGGELSCMGDCPGGESILAAHEHYCHRRGGLSGGEFYIVGRLFLYYHSLANNRCPSRATNGCHVVVPWWGVLVLRGELSTGSRTQ